MFGGNMPKATSTSAVDTLIGRQSEILGDVRFSGGLHVDGKIKGKVIANSDKAASLSISETGSIEGDVRVPNIVLNGSVSGDVHASGKITLAAKARVTGNVYYKIIEMEGGAQVNGQMVHEANPGAAASEPDQATLDELSEARRVKGMVG
jgi:cytoskeletal protein CcmA (bactofilin family)